jgi:hypothetical protein
MIMESRLRMLATVESARVRLRGAVAFADR